MLQNTPNLSTMQIKNDLSEYVAHLNIIIIIEYISALFKASHILASKK